MYIASVLSWFFHATGNSDPIPTTPQPVDSGTVDGNQSADLDHASEHFLPSNSG